MSKKSLTNFTLEKAFAPISKSSVIDQILTEIEIKEIPIKYIECVLIQYFDGEKLKIEPSFLKHSVSLNNGITSNFEEYTTKDVRVFISTEKLESDVNKILNRLLEKFC